ncbi:MAG TPA: hypothetical protein PKD55_26095 [Bellilinea sp.]|nr:hypothetical protein [Bellilinea sp.]
MDAANFLESQSRNQVGITPFCELSNDNLQGLVKLLAWIADSVLPLPHLLAGIWIVPEGQMITFVNQVIAQFAPDANLHKLGTHEPDGVAIPIETENSATALILLDAQPLRQLNADHPFVPEVISTLLEELLHVELYSIRWERGLYS